MAHFIAGLFEDSTKAGHAISDLIARGYTKDISVISKQWNGFSLDIKSHQIKEDPSDGATMGAIAGGIVGGLGALLAGLTAIAIPGGLFIVGPLAITIAAVFAGAAVGGLVGVLVDLGIPEKQAELFTDQIAAGQTLAAVTVGHDKEESVVEILGKHGATEAELVHVDV